MTSKAEQKRIEKAEALAELVKILKPGQKVYTVVRHVARSGMSRLIDVYTVQDGELRYLSGYASKVLDWPRDRSGALKVSGCGMDMCFQTVYCLSESVFKGQDRAGYVLNKEDI